MITKKMLEFLMENRVRDSKQWFDEHKAQYNEVVIQPLGELVEELAPTMHQIDNQILCVPKVGKSISRIHRDIRFSKDKSKYRDVMWLSFMREKKLYNGVPGFFVEVSPSGFRYGCGYYQASANTMQRVRDLIVAKDPLFLKAKKAYEAQDVFSMEGEMYKKSRYPNESDDLKQWLDKKSIFFMCQSNNFDLLFSDDFAPMIAKHFMTIAPLYHFLMYADIGG